jgi:hypothetical protein
MASWQNLVNIRCICAAPYDLEPWPYERARLGRRTRKKVKKIWQTSHLPRLHSIQAIEALPGIAKAEALLQHLFILEPRRAIEFSEHPNDKSIHKIQLQPVLWA